MKAQELYDLREKLEFCSGTDLHEYFESELGDPSPSGHVEIDRDEAKAFVGICLEAIRHNNGETLDYLYTVKEQEELVSFLAIKDLTDYTRFDDTPRTFIEVPGWYGGHGLAPIAKPVMRHALPERKPGRKVKTTMGIATVVRVHNCEGRFWCDEGVLLDNGLFYRPRWRNSGR